MCAEVASVLRKELGLELQAVNYRRLLSHDGITLADLRDALAWLLEAARPAATLAV